MATFSERTITGWSGPVVLLQDLFVEAAYRRNGVARALIARVATHAKTIGSPMVEFRCAPTIRHSFFTSGAEFRCYRPAPLTCWPGLAPPLAAGDKTICRSPASAIVSNKIGLSDSAHSLPPPPPPKHISDQTADILGTIQPLYFGAGPNRVVLLVSSWEFGGAAVGSATHHQRGCQVMSPKIAITPAKAGQPSANQMRNRSRY